MTLHDPSPRVADHAAPGTLFDLADRDGARLATSCGRAGTCHECIVEVTRGAEALAPRTEAEAFLDGDYRLACQARLLGPATEIAFTPVKRRRQIVTEGTRPRLELDPAVTRAGDTVHRGGTRIDAYRGAIYGLAVDVGTTTVVLNLVDLERGEVLETAAFENPQRFGGSDVMHRISYDAGPGRGELHRSIVAAVNAEIRDFCRRRRFVRRLIYEVVVVGNPTMRDLFFGLDVDPIGRKPYRSTTETAWRAGGRATTALSVPAVEVGLHVNRAALVYGAPLVGSHVGADAAACLLAVGADRPAEAEGPFMLVDVGTNTEVIVGDGRRLLAASCPAGPAFEGAGVGSGMPGCEGAIESVEAGEGGLVYRVIGGGRPEGICGSGLIDLLAVLRRTGRMDRRGSFASGAERVAVAPEADVVLARADVSQLAQAKAANACGQRLLLSAFGIEPRDLRRVYLAGGFARYVDVDNAVAIGLLPDVPRERVVKVGNAALDGATMLLASRRRRAALEALVVGVKHLELEEEPEFFDAFVDGCLFQPM